MFPAHWLRPLQRLDTLATLCGDGIFLTTPSPARFFRFPQRNRPFPVLSAVNCPMIRRREILHAAPVGALCRIWLASSLAVPHPGLSGAPSSALLLPFLTSSLGLEAWPECWVSVEFLHAPIPRKGLGSTTPQYSQPQERTKEAPLLGSLYAAT